MEIFKNKRLTICYIGLILMFILVGNSNNNPSTYIERIFKPISLGSGTFYYSLIIVMVIIYYCLKGINDEKEMYFMNSFFSRFIATIILINAFVWLGGYSTKFYKSFYNNLNSIYMNRDETSIDVNLEDNKLSINGEISILNCSNKVQEFSIKIKSPSLIKNNINEDYIVLKDKVKIYPREEQNLYINEEFDYDIKNQGVNTSSHTFEYILFNDDEDVIFEGSRDEYHTDYLDTKY